jgi:hypothetical protein
MDPWLESTAIWHGFHEKLIVKTCEVLQPELRSRGYYVDIGERVWLTVPGRGIFPDDVILHAPRQAPTERGGESVATIDEPVRVTRSQVEVREGYIEIYDGLRHEIVTGLEFLSPTNKRNQKGRKLYRRKQIELRSANVHLVEIDFLRRGPHVLDIPQDVVEAFRPWHYLAHIVRRGSDKYEFYPIKLRARLPRIRIPLKVGDDDAVLDLQDVFNRSYEIGPYPERLDYSQPPPPPELNPDDAAWADEILKSKGLRQ